MEQRLRHPGGAPKAVTVPLNSGTEWLSAPVTASVPQAAGVSGGSVGPTLSLDVPGTPVKVIEPFSS